MTRYYKQATKNSHDGRDYGDGYIKLLYAIAKQAVDDLCKLRFPEKPKGSNKIEKWQKRINELEQIQKSAQAYIFDDNPYDENNIFSFRSILKITNTSIGRARASIKKRIEEIEEAKKELANKKANKGETK